MKKSFKHTYILGSCTLVFLLSLSNISYADNKVSNINNNNLSLLSNTTNDNYLKPEDAFHFQAFIVGKNKILAQWAAQDGYHFYHDKFQFFSTTGVLLGQAQIDKGEMVFNKALNQTLEENKGLVNITIPIIAHKSGEFEIISVSQGCADTICYPPQKRAVRLKIN